MEFQSSDTSRQERLIAYCQRRRFDLPNSRRREGKTLPNASHQPSNKEKWYPIRTGAEYHPDGVNCTANGGDTAAREAVGEGSSEESEWDDGEQHLSGKELAVDVSASYLSGVAELRRTRRGCDLVAWLREVSIELRATLLLRWPRGRVARFIPSSYHSSACPR